MAIYRIYTITAVGSATLRRELRNSTDEEALRMALALLPSLPGEVTWLLESDSEDDANDNEAPKSH